MIVILPNAVFPRSRGSDLWLSPKAMRPALLLVYASAWIKCHHPAIFACALLNSQPMGFYAPAQIVRDAREHGVVVRPVCINASYWDNTLEPDGRGGLALRLGFRQIKGLREEDAQWITAARGNGYQSVQDVWRRAGLAPAALVDLVNADAFANLGIHRRQALWDTHAIPKSDALPLFAHDLEGEVIRETLPNLPQATLGEILSMITHPYALACGRIQWHCCAIS